MEIREVLIYKVLRTEDNVLFIGHILMEKYLKGLLHVGNTMEMYLKDVTQKFW